ncbi:HET-domain-containing protein [Aspergillus piperis CBS 112811]|uniref:HET-domain-containing protein n=1 Tax=Aspergillus piperis CBS 112811 TaxID=1448313 RepID=A0A8G1QZY7_9EURO|nr:HET-domain-containing protein [Aspergillus piperis CBS 112811]RAH56657.1 HET-domain-containing protein [Aspergillus piperis CBS 112811]
MARKAHSLLKHIPGASPKINRRKEKSKETLEPTYRQDSSNSGCIFVLEDPADFPRWKGIIERLLQVQYDLGDGNTSTYLRKDYNFLWEYVPRHFHHHFPHSRELFCLEAEELFRTLWVAVHEWAVDCTICGLVRRKVLSDPLDLVKAREQPMSRFLLKSKGGKRCQYCSLVYQCLQAYYPSFETHENTLVVGIYPNTGGFSLLIRDTQTTSWIESTLWAEAFPVQDAVEVCWRLGIKYLWVDALCIIQDDAIGVDWYEQSSEMDQIYSSAYVVIAADTAEDCSEGFLGTSQIQQLREVTVDWDGDTYICREKPNGQRDDPSFLLSRTPLSRRAWTLQETLLPSRVLHYTGTEIVLRLGDTFYCQCGECRFHHVGISQSDWHQIVSHYSFRQMTKPSDKLSALSGLAARMSDGDRKYLAGLWSDTLVTDLLWHSWASMDGGISYFTRFSYYDFLPALDIMQAECTCTSVNSFGPVSSGFIDLRGKLVPVEMVILDKPFTKHQGEYTGEWGRATRVHQGQTSLVRGWGTEIYEVLCDERMEKTDRMGEEERESWAQGKVDRQDLGGVVASNVYCLEVGTIIDRVLDVDGFTALGRSSRVWWLVLKKAERGDEFKRVGIGYKSSKDFKRDCDLFDSAEWSTVRLV